MQGLYGKKLVDLQTRINAGWLPEKCFPAHTRIQTSRTTSTAISALRVGDVVLAYDSRADNSRGLSRLGMAG